jgi:uncharacterized membrane protein YeaQ/YmgE (transglycosylase-associated protein family)
VEVLTLIITGGIAGWIAGVLIRGAGHGLVINIVVGVVGGVIGGKLRDLLGLGVDGGWLVNLAMAVIGAALLLALVNLTRRAE